MGNKVKAHIRYKNKEGKLVPGTTTITGLLAKPALIGWANRLGLEGIDCNKYKDKMADIGILAHYFVMADFKGISEEAKEKALEEYSAVNIDKAENCILSFFEWKKGHSFKSILVETPIVSETHQFGGKPDWYGLLDDQLTLLDIKTGNAVYPEMFYQLGGYYHVIQDNGHTVDRAKIIRIGRSQDEGFEERSIDRVGMKHNGEIFLQLRKLYKLINGK